MAFAQTATCKCTKCFWRRTATFGDASPYLAPHYERCPLCGSPTATTSRLTTDLDRLIGSMRDALPLALALGAGALALDILLKFAGEKGN